MLTRRDLRVRYSTSLLGYFWSILDPLVMAGIYWFVFTQVFHRTGGGHEPYIVFLLSALLPWMWFNGAVSDSTRAFLREAKLIRSTRIPRTIWVNSLVLTKGIEFLASIPVLALFAIAYGAEGERMHAEVGVGLVVAPLVVFFRDLERAVKLVLRFLFYASPIIYSTTSLPRSLHSWVALNPLSGILSLYRSAFFPDQLNWSVIGVGALVSAALLCVGVLVFTRTEHAILKEI